MLRHVSEVLKYQGDLDLLEQLTEWPIPRFSVTEFDLKQRGLMSGYRFARILQSLKQQWKSSRFTMTKDELMQYGFKSGLFYS